MNRIIVAALAVLLVSAAANPASAQESDAATGQKLFQRRCGACHQIDTARNGVGPHLQGIVGRTAGTVPGVNYSTGLREAGITWSAETMETFLADPATMVRGTRMTQRFSNAEERRAIIAFLSTR